ncbi:hypothetical protein JIG36_34140 [Actinoplanes sp. LDG1-06]|uniref:DUF1905 domain-containing protein n=1 Tax=Paractinoplanes ovalisporus TaxID=2810368 RepID=A0ABS2AMX3_9ACTN|nr:hypothetical protein [Actinoplanes ovalisporus]MBM2620554.1 hypothetical protein [Actinoplanes ovalisporus]
MTPSYPVLPSDPGQAITTEGRVADVRGRAVLLLPFTAPVGRSRGVRYRTELDGGPPQTRVVISSDGRAILLDRAVASVASGTVLSVRLKPLAARGDLHLPRDLVEEAHDAALDLTGVPDHELALIITMLREASTPQIRQARKQHVLASLQPVSGEQT